MDNEDLVKFFLTGENLEYILFKVAIHYAEKHTKIWYISPEPFKSVPENIIPPSKEVLQLITFVYLKDSKVLISHLNSIHLWHQLPQVILVYGFDKYSKINEDVFDYYHCSLIMTSLIDALSSVSKKTNRLTYLVVTSSPIEKQERMDIIRNFYFPEIYKKKSDEETFEEIIKKFKVLL